jgi:hypothetical protein
MKNAILLGVALLLLIPFATSYEITQMSVHAPSVSQGSQVTLTYTLQASSPLGRVTTDVYLPGGINHRETRSAPTRTYQHSQSFRLPRSYQAHDEVYVRVQAQGQPAITKRIPLQTRPTTTQPSQPTAPQIIPETGVAIIVDPVRDVIPGDAIYYRVQVYNNHDQPTPVTIGLSDVSEWATYRVDPAPTQLVAPNQVTDYFVYLDVDNDAYPGTKYFDVTASYPGQQERAGVRLAVLKPLEQPTTTSFAPWIIAAAIILILLAAALIIASNYRKDNDEEEGGGDDDFITYY